MSLAATLALALAGGAQAQTPMKGCDAAGIGSTSLSSGESKPGRPDPAAPKILSVSTGTEGGVSYCLVKVLVPQAINIWVGLPMNGAWNGRWQSVGGGVYAGTVNVPGEALRAGYAAATTDTGHAGGRPGAPGALDGSFGMLKPGEPNLALQKDFAYRSEHLMAVIGKQLVQAFYGTAPKYSYWNGCSTGGRQGLRMAQDYPEDYDGILTGAPAIHWDRFQAAMLWYPMVQRLENGGPIGGGKAPVLAAKYRLATDHAVAACDAMDGVKDGVLGDPRRCTYSASGDASLTLPSCTADNTQCLTSKEAAAIDKSWLGPVSCADGTTSCAATAMATRDLKGNGAKRLWYGQLRGTDLAALGGVAPFPVAIEQPRYWVYLDPNWDWQQLDYGTMPRYFRDTIERVGPMMASDDPDLRAFRKRGGKLVMWHGWSDQLINAQGSVDYYERVVKKMGGLPRTQQFARLFMAPGVGHCAGGPGPQPQQTLDAVVNWVERGTAPEKILALKQAGGVTQSRPLCPYPEAAHWSGSGSTDEAANFSCVAPDPGH